MELGFEEGVGLKIERVKVYPISIPLVSLEDGGLSPYSTVSGEVENAESLVLKVETDEGISGWGEMDMVLSPSTMKKIIEDDVASKVKDEDPFQVRRIRNKLSFDVSSQHFSAPAFASGIEVACWDIVGKALGRPLSELFGGRVRDLVPVSYCMGILNSDQSRRKAESVVEDGFRTLKVKAVGDLASDLARVESVRAGGGDDLNIRVDPNQAFTVSEAVRFLKKVEKLDLQYVEQPIRINSFDDLVSLRYRTKTPIAINEDCYMESNLMRAIKKEAIDVAVVDYEPLGGLSRLFEIGGLAKEANLPLAHHCGFDLGVKTAAILQGTSCISNFIYAMDSTYYSHLDDVLKGRLEVEDGAFEVPAGPGLGVEVDKEKIEEYRTDR